MKDYEIEPGEYDEDANEHGALQAIETQLRYLGPIIAEALTEHGVNLANAMDEQSEAQRRIADALDRVADALGAIAKAISHRG